MKRFCHLCGGAYLPNRTQPWVCSSCGNKSFANAKPTVEIALFDDAGRILLAKRGIEPNKGAYDLPGGFIDLKETAEHALVREIQEELGLEPCDYSQPVFVYSWVGDSYVYSKETHVTLNLVFAARIGTKQPNAHDDVAELHWQDPSNLKDIRFSFPKYPEIIAAANKALLGDT